jgi:uncharacterized protein YqjF (DUF2071 family)
MMKWLKQHPFPVEAWFDRVLALSFAVPESIARKLISPKLEVDAYEGCGFMTVALVWTKDLRPAGFPKWLGRDFFLAGFRVFVRMRDEEGRRLRGLKILRSETDRAGMVVSGNLLTHYNYRLAEVKLEECEGVIRVRTFSRDGTPSLDIEVDTSAMPDRPPEGSPFRDWRTARQFAGPMPFTFDDNGDGRFVVIEGKRSEWTPRPVTVKSWKVAMFDEEPFAGITPVLANAFMVEGVPYRWERGRLMTPGGDPS